MPKQRRIREEPFTIMSGEARSVWRVTRHFPWLVRWVTDRQHEQARRKTGRVALGVHEAIRRG
jgi:hypothetical protein